jgi:hypothetical protein
VPREKPPRRRHTSMRAPFAPLTNAPRRVRPRALSQSSESESEHDENDRHLAPVGDVIGAAHPRLRREFVTLSEFAFDLQNGSRDRTRKQNYPAPRTQAAERVRRVRRSR